MEFVHKSIMLEEVIESLAIKPNGIYVDGTLGGAGHSFEIATNLKNTGTLIGIDRDEEAIKKAKDTLKDFKNVIYVQDNHDNIKEILERLNIEKVDGILLDLGVSSYQIDEETRGFSYIKNSPLDMRMDKTQKLTAKEVVNTYSEQSLADIIYKYGEEKFSRQIARRICEYRKTKEIETTTELVQIIEKCVPKQNAYKDSVGKCTCPPDLPYCVCGNKSKGKIKTKKPILPTEEEMKINSRSKSAKLRIFEKN